jgi:hypothetical protein
MGCAHRRFLSSEFVLIVDHGESHGRKIEDRKSEVGDE